LLLELTKTNPWLVSETGRLNLNNRSIISKGEGMEQKLLYNEPKYKKSFIFNDGIVLGAFIRAEYMGLT